MCHFAIEFLSFRSHLCAFERCNFLIRFLVWLFITLLPVSQHRQLLNVLSTDKIFTCKFPSLPLVFYPYSENYRLYRATVYESGGQHEQTNEKKAPKMMTYKQVMHTHVCLWELRINCLLIKKEEILSVSFHPLF